MWRKQFGGLSLSELRELRQLREENGRLKRLVADAWQPHATPEWPYRAEYKWYERIYRQPGVLNKITPAAPGELPTRR